MRPRSLLPPFIVLIAALFIACGGGDDAPDSAGEAPTPAAAQAEEQSEDEQGEEELSIEDRTVAAAVAARAAGIETLGRDEEFALTEAELVPAIDAVEALIASCMREAGFQYVPVDVVTVRQSGKALGKVAGVSNEDFAAQFGFGISTGVLEARFVLVLGENGRIFEDLSDADQVAYTLTLVGEDDEAVFHATLEEEDFSATGGCTRAAIAQVFDEGASESRILQPGGRISGAGSAGPGRAGVVVGVHARGRFRVPEHRCRGRGLREAA